MKNLKKKALILGVLASLSVCGSAFAAEQGSTATIPTNTTGPNVDVTTPGGQVISEKINSFDVPLISTGTGWTIDAISSSEFESKVTEEVKKNVTEEFISTIVTEEYLDSKVKHSTVAGDGYIEVSPDPTDSRTAYTVSAKTGEGGLATYEQLQDEIAALEFTTVSPEGTSKYLTVGGTKNPNEPGAYTVAFDDEALAAAMAEAAKIGAIAVDNESAFTTNNGATSVSVKDADGTVVLDLTVGEKKLDTITISDIASATALSELSETVEQNTSAIQANADAIQENANAIQANADNISKNAEAIATEAGERKDEDQRIWDAIKQQQGDTNIQINKLSNEIDTVGALSAAMAGLHPRFQDGNKGEVAAAVGTYDGKQAMAIGGFYAPNQEVMFSLGAAIAEGGKKMGNFGVNFALDRSKDRKAAPKDIVYTRKEVDAMLSQQAEQIAALMAEVKALKEGK